MKNQSLSLIRNALLTGIVVASMGVALAATPTMQKAIVQTGHGGPEVLSMATVPVPEPGPNEVLIRVFAAAINPVDWKVRAGVAEYAPPPGTPASTRAIPGGDAAGRVEKVGAGVTAFKPGDAVFAIIPRKAGVMNGAYAEFAVAPVSAVATKPANVTYLEAAGLGIATVTGVRAVKATHVSKGQRVLITGVAGGVGSAAAQAAKARGAIVIGTASARHNEYLRGLDVDEVIDYTKVKFEDAAKNIDVVIDTVGADTAERAMTTLRKGSMYISIAARNLEAKCQAAGLICGPRNPPAGVPRDIFDDTVALAAAGKLNVHIDKAFPLEQAAQAQLYGEQGRTQGKIGLIVNASEASKQ